MKLFFKLPCRDLAAYLFYCYVLMAVMVPRSVLPKVSVVLLLSFLVFSIKAKQKILVDFLSNTGLVMVIFISSALLAVIKGNWTQYSVQFLMFAVFPLIFIVNLWSRVDVGKVVVVSSVLLFFLTLMIFIEIILLNSANIFFLLNDFNQISYGVRDIGVAEVWYLRVSSVPVLLTALSVVLYESLKNPEVKLGRYKILLLLALWAMVVLSSQRGLIITCGFLTVLYVFLISGFFLKLFFGAVALFAMVSLISYLIGYGGDVSTQVRADDWVNFIRHLTENPYVFLFGDGLGAEFFRVGKGFYSVTENTFLDLVRYMGFPLVITFLFALFVPQQIRGNRNYLFLICAMLAYCILSSSNPALLNAYGVITVLWYWSEISKLRDVEEVVV